MKFRMTFEAECDDSVSYEDLLHVAGNALVQIQEPRIAVDAFHDREFDVENLTLRVERDTREGWMVVGLDPVPPTLPAGS